MHDAQGEKMLNNTIRLQLHEQFTQKSFCMHFIYMHDITPLDNLLKFNDGLHFYS